MNKNVKKLVLSGICLGLCMVLPFLTGQIPQIGSMISPMHIPVFLCGFLCGWPYALVMGFIAPILRYFLFGMPPILPTGMAMAFELAAYGAVAGFAYKRAPKTNIFIYVSLIAAMLAGRAVWGIASMAIYGLQGNQFTFSAFLAGAFIKAVPAIIIHIAIIPVLVIAAKRAGFIENE